MDFIEFYQDLSSLEVVSKDKHKIAIKLRDVPMQYANALRRVCLNGVPIFAIDTVDVVENSSVLPDEGLAHRLGLIPITTDSSRFNEPSECECQSETGCSNCKVMLVLDSGNSNETRSILSDELSSEDDLIKPISDKIPIVQLAPGQRIKIECYAKLGRGTEHAKWNSANVATLTDTEESENIKLLTIESTGSLNPEQIVIAGVDEINSRLNQFKDMINSVKVN